MTCPERDLIGERRGLERRQSRLSNLDEAKTSLLMTGATWRVGNDGGERTFAGAKPSSLAWTLLGFVRLRPYSLLRVLGSFSTVLPKRSFRVDIFQIPLSSSGGIRWRTV